MHSLVYEPVPGLSFAVFKGRVAESTPFLEQRCCRIFLFEVGMKSFFKAAAKDHGCAGILLTPTIEIAVAIAAGAAKILADLRVAIDHGRPPANGSPQPPGTRVLPTRLRERMPRGSERCDRPESRGKSEQCPEDLRELCHRPDLR